MMCSSTTETGQKSRFFDLLSLRFSQKLGFFIQKGSNGFFGIRYIILSYFPYVFATSVAKNWSARARSRKNPRNAKRRFATFAPEIGLFSLKTAATAHTELQQGNTSQN